jgi:hypothetical protein
MSAVQRCPVCEYDLAGLPAAHACPECGFEYDERTIVLYGARTGQSVQPLLVGLFGYLTAVTWIAGYRWVSLGLLLGAACILWQMFANRRRFNTRGGRTQLVATREGVSLREGPGPPDLVPWPRIRQFRLRRFHRLGLSWRKPLPPAWHVSFSSGGLFDPMRMTGRMPAGRNRVYMNLVFDADRREAARVDGVLRDLFEAGRSASASPPA